MSNHLLVMPVLVPLLAGALLLLLSGAGQPLKRALSIVATLALLPVAVALLVQLQAQPVQIYALGDWQPPFGIVLVGDHLSALLLLVMAVLALPVVLSMCRGLDSKGDNFHALFQFQLMGINGAFLTGDLFNLFVFFEILLIASYALLVHGLLRERVAAGVHYVILNLVGSSLFLIAAGLLYGVTGTLNFADLAVRVPELPAADLPIARAAGLLLLLVFALKAALLPVGLWLPATYGSASAPVAALFAVMTKVGIYAIIRVHSLLFSDGPLAGTGEQLIGWLALLTLLVASCGLLAARRLQTLAAWLTLVSVGTLLAIWSFGSADGLAAMLYYLIHSTWISAALFLLVGLISQRRGELSDQLRVGSNPGAALGLTFMVVAVALVGLPPLSGFIGKLLLLQAADSGAAVVPFWVLLLLSSLAGLIAFSRAGSTLFWRHGDAVVADNSSQPGWPLWLLLPLTVVLAVAAEPLLDYLQQAATSILNPSVYIDGVLGVSGGDAQ